MEQRPHREFRPSEEEFERREKDRLRKFFNWYPIAAAVICMALGIILFTTVMNMPGFGQEDNPINNEVAERYLEHSEEETGSENVVTAMIIGYRGFDTLGGELRAVSGGVGGDDPAVAGPEEHQRA